MSSQEKIDQDFKIDYNFKLGTGAFGQVFRGIWISKNCFVAVKRIKEFIGNAKQIIDQEINVMKNLNHQNILTILKVAQTKEGTYLIIQYCEGGSLQKQISKGIPELNCLEYLKQIVDGMAAVNKALHIHRDLKPENILFTKEKKLKICDFGLARRILGDDPDKIEKFSAKGTPLFSAPQILRHQKYSGKCDVWSAGAILVQMLTKINPFHKAKNLASLINLQQALREKGHFVLEGNFNPWFKDIVSKMLAFDQDNRWSFAMLKQHIDNDYEKLRKSYGRFDNIPATVVTRQTAAEGQTTIFAEQAANLQQKMNKLKQKKYQQANGGKVSRQQQKLLTREENKKLLTNLKCYVEFLYNRGKLFADIGTKYFQTKEVTKTNGYKFMLLFLAISIFIKNIEKIFNITSKQTEVKLPDGTLIKYSSLDEASVKEFGAIRKDYENQMKEEINKFSATIAQIEAKMLSDKYKKQYPELINQYKNDLLKDLVDMKNNRSERGVDYYEAAFERFFKKQCRQPNTLNMQEAYLRIYFVCIKLANLSATIPTTRFKDNYIINQIIDDSAKLSVDKIRQEILTLNAKL